MTGTDDVRPPVVPAVIALAAAIVAAAIILPLTQWMFGRALTSADFAALAPSTRETLFTLVAFGALLAVAATGLALGNGWRGVAGRAPLPMAATGFALGSAGLLVAVVYAAVALHVARGTGGAPAAIVTGTLVVLVQAAVEEVYFRGWLQPLLVRAWGPAAGVAIVALAFAALHIAGGERAAMSLVNLFAGGVFFGLLALRSGGIVLPLAAHFGWNWLETIGLGLSPNPGTGSFGAFVDLDMIGAATWGGSAEGLNASLGVTFALAALIAPVVTWRGGINWRASPG